MPKVSVIVPVYRAEGYLHACVDSILSQTFPDLEVFLVDDGSPDGSGAICDAYAVRDSRVSVIHQENQGQAAARNHALAKARGEWVCFVDSDDLIHPQMVQLLLAAAEESGTAMSVCQMLEAVELPEDFDRPRQGGYQELAMDEETLLTLHDRDEYPAWVACAKLIRREIVMTHLFREGRVYEDNEAVCHWILQAKTLAWIPQDLYFYRGNPESTTKREFSRKRLDYLWALEEIIRFYTSAGYLRLRERFVARYVEAAASCIRGVRDTLGEPGLARKTERSVRRFLRKEKLCLTREQFEFLLDAAHPKLIRLYWPLAGAVRTLRETGLGGLWRKIRKQFGKGAEK